LWHIDKTRKISFRKILLFSLKKSLIFLVVFVLDFLKNHFVKKIILSLEMKIGFLSTKKKKRFSKIFYIKKYLGVGVSQFYLKKNKKFR
jgi:hypothetical protein